MDLIGLKLCVWKKQ